jgi:transposase
MQVFSNEIFKEPKLTIGVDLGDHWSFYCVLDEAAKIILEQKIPTTPEAMRQTFGKIPRSLIALETGTHSPWVSRLLTELGHEVIMAHAQKVELITKSHRKEDRHDARTLAVHAFNTSPPSFERVVDRAADLAKALNGQVRRPQKMPQLGK